MFNNFIYKIGSVILGILLFASTACEKLDLTKIAYARTDTVEILGTSVLAHGTVLDVGESKVMEHGHCWATHPNPSIDDYHTLLGIKEDAGEYISNLDSLIPGRVHYLKSYAYDGEKYVYGEDVEFEITADDLDFVSNDPEFVKVGTITVESSVDGVGAIKFTSHGHCWSHTDPPTIDDETVSDLGELGADTSFVSKIHGLTMGGYYVRGYAEIDGEVIYSNTVFYESVISVETLTPSLNPTNSAVAYGLVQSFGVSPILDHGHCWSTTSSNPILNDNGHTEHSSLGEIGALKVFSTNLENLISGRTYYVRAYATDGSKVYYGQLRSFVSN